MGKYYFNGLKLRKLTFYENDDDRNNITEKKHEFGKSRKEMNIYITL